MKNFRHEGRTCTFVATAAIKAGEGALFGIWFGVANNDAAIGEEVELDLTGVFDLKKSTAGGSAIGANTKVYWDDTNKVVTGTATSNKLIGGTQRLAAADGDATARVRLNGVSV